MSIFKLETKQKSDNKRVNGNLPKIKKNLSHGPKMIINSSIVKF